MVYIRFTKSAKAVSWFPFLSYFFRPFKEINSLICVRISSQILDLKNETVSVPLFTVFTTAQNMKKCLMENFIFCAVCTETKSFFKSRLHLVVY